MENFPESAPLPPEVISSFETAPSFHEKLLDTLREGVYFVDRERRIQYWNKGAELLTGYAASEVVGKLCVERVSKIGSASKQVLTR
jgi:PAS domain S-box-containing protein